MKKVKKRGSGFDFKKTFFDAVNHVKDSKKYIYFVVLVFLVFTLVGYFVSLPEDLTNQILKYFEGLIRMTENFSSSEMVWFLFQNNVSASFFGLFLGVLFGVFSLFNAVLNGFVLGFASKISVTENGIFSLWRLLPHGIFELPALFISLGLGVRLGMFMFKGEDSLRTLLKKSIKSFLFVVIPLLILAAVIEGLLITL